MLSGKMTHKPEIVNQMVSMNRRLVLGMLTGAVIGLTTAMGNAAWAFHYDNLVPYDPPGAQEPSSIYRTDNSDVYYYMAGSGSFGLESADKTVVRDMLSSQYVPTDLAIIYDTTLKTSGSGETDTIWQEGDVSGSATGRTWCDDPVGIRRCDQHYIRIEPGHFNRGLTCHEMGHAVGLTHGGDAYPSVSNQLASLACMRTPVSTTDVLGPHNRDQINVNY